MTVVILGQLVFSPLSQIGTNILALLMGKLSGFSVFRVIHIKLLNQFGDSFIAFKEK